MKCETRGTKTQTVQGRTPSIFCTLEVWDEQSTSNYFQIITISTILSFSLDRHQHPFCQLRTSSGDHETSSWETNQQVDLNPERRRANDYVRPTSVLRSQYTALLVHAADQPKSVVYTGYCAVSARIIFHNRRGAARLGDLKIMPSEPCNILYIVHDKSFAKLQGTISKKGVHCARSTRDLVCPSQSISATGWQAFCWQWIWAWAFPV